MKSWWKITVLVPFFVFSHMVIAAEDTEDESGQASEQTYLQSNAESSLENAVKAPKAPGKRKAKTVPADAENRGETVEIMYPRYAQELRMLVQLSKETGIKPKDIASMLEALRRERDIQDILDGKVDAAKVARAYAAVKGTLPFNPIGNTGRAINKLTGESIVYDKNIANLADQTERARINQRTAATRRDNANTAKTQAQTKQRNATQK